MKRYAIVEKRTKRMVGSAATIDVATAALDAVGAPLCKNFEIVPHTWGQSANAR